MSDILLEVMKCVVIISTMLVVRYLCPYLRSKVKQMTNADLKDFIEDSVRWAKQTLKDNEEKKQKVLEKVVVYASSKGLNISYEILDMLIEAVYETVKKEDNESK